MSIWGKVIGGATGLAFGGPLGAAFGAAVGHAYDRWTAAAWSNLWAFVPGGAALRGTFEQVAQQVSEQARQSVFALAVLSLGSALARADGPVNAAEEDAFLRLFGVAEGSEAEGVSALLRRGLPLGEAESQARRLGGLFSDRPELLEELLAALVLLGRADGPLNEAEEDLLTRLATAMGLSPRAWERARSGAGGAAAGQEDPFAVLGVAPTASDTEIRAAYRTLLREHHPDMLMARGLPAEFVEVANRRMAAINSAYDVIARRRGLKP